MIPKPKIKLFLVDDDKLYLNILKIQFLETNNFEVHTFELGESCIENLNLNPEIIILDYNLDGINKNAINGINTLDKIKEKNPETIVIMLSSQDKIEVAINCMHHQATDYVVKSETCFLRLVKIIETVLDNKKNRKQLDWYMKRM